MPIITLTSDWGYKDHYQAAVKGSILSKYKEAVIADISHDISCFDIEQAAFIIKNAFPFFPEGTIHIIGINTEASAKTPHLLIKYKKHYFIGADNGLFSLLFHDKPEKIIEIDIPQDSDYFTFSARDVFVKVACHIARGGSMDYMGKPVKMLSDKRLIEPNVDANSIKGIITYIDNYENAITNIDESLFKKIAKNRKFVINVRMNEIKKISKAYSEVPKGEILALFGSNGMMQIALNMSNAEGLLGLKTKDTVRIDFE
jgi:S-adenosyl-L-methionine hydrolase (adenosine-forming)